MNKSLRITIGSILAVVGIVFFILPGSILFLIGGLMLLSYDVPHARSLLKKCQSSMSNGAKRVDRFILNRKLR